MQNADTIFALSTAAGKSGVALIRVSGADLGQMARAIIGRDNVTPRHAYFTALRDGECLIDHCVVTYFAAPQSFTGEDVIEISTHGSPAVVRRVFDYLSARFGARMAMPGEFSRRAFNNEKMDLADVDALAALLDAQTERQRIQAITAITGDGARYNAWRTDMVEIAAYAAAMMDYNADDLPANIGEKIGKRIENLHTEITDAISRYAAVRAVRSGFNIVLAGPTNAGKSSLFNRILGENRAIVSNIPGTTRDVVTATIDIDGYMVNIADTAGLRETADEIEQIGIGKTNEQIASADLILNLGPAMGLENEITVINKSDSISTRDNTAAIYVSAKTGDGIENLMSAVHKKMHELMSRADGALVLNERTRAMLIDVADNLNRAMELKDNYDLIAEHIRAAADAIGRILGTISVQEVMDATFSQLCLGK